MEVIFPNTLDVRFHIYNEGVVWEFLAPFYAIYDANTPQQRIKRVPPGQFVDFASVPRLPIVYLIYANRFHVAAAVHDNDYEVGGTEEDRRQADEDFLTGALATVNAYQTKEHAHAMYDAVRTFGKSHFKYVGVP